jgi:hypothetical protein
LFDDYAVSQETTSTGEDLCSVRQTIHLAQEMGKGVGRCEVLQ